MSLPTPHYSTSTSPNRELNGFSICIKFQELPRKRVPPAKPPPYSSGTESTDSLTIQSEPPSYWTKCPNCSPNAKRKYHLIDLSHTSAEWAGIADPLTKAGFTVTRVRRIQNLQLWNRFQFEKQLMIKDRPASFNINEVMLYHTTSAPKEAICEEGLDQRLSRSDGTNRFGRGTYFR